MCACALALTACGSTGLVGNHNARSESGVNATPGRTVDSVGWLVNHSGRTVALQSATVLRLKGFPPPTLTHVAVERIGRGSTFQGLMTAGATTGWPPSGIRVRQFRGYRLRSEGPLVRHTALIVFGLVARTVGRYAVAGVNVTVRDDGSAVTVHVIGPLDLCVGTKRHAVSCPGSFGNRVLRAAEANGGQ